jgi:hypothetical protein
MRSILVFSIAAVAFVSAAFSQANGPYVRVLVPIYGANAIPGAYGSLWTSEIVGRNESDRYVEIVQQLSGLCGTCPQPPAQPRSSFAPLAQVPNPGGGIFLYISAASVGKVRFNARIQDVSRQAQTWGTQIPLVREQDTFTGPFGLLNVPVDDRFRQTLRIYDFDGINGAQVSVRVYEQDTDVQLTEKTITLRQASFDPSPNPGLPAMAQFGLTEEFPMVVANGKRVRLEIVPVTSSIRVWAFISVTNNETQHVTTITPQQF